MIRLKPIVTERNTVLFFKAVGRVIASAIALFLFVIWICPAESPAQDKEASFGVMVKDFEFYRPYKLPESEDLAALKSRRRQLTDMITGENQSLATSPTRTQDFIKDHIQYLEKSLELVDKEIAAEGDTRIPVQTLHEATKEYKGRELTLDEMKEVADIVTTTYQDNGYILAQAYIPEQEIADGILKIAINEGDIGEIRVTGNSYYDERVVKRNFMEQLNHGVIREELLEKGILLTKELPGAETRIVLEPGEEPGTANVDLQTQDSIAFNMSLDVNNFGTDLVGKERYGTSIELTEPWWGSTVSARGVTGNRIDNSNLHSYDFSIPVGDYGTRVAVGYLKGGYAVGGTFEDLGIEGETTIYSARIAHPVLRTRNNNVTFTTGYDRKRFTQKYYKGETEALHDKIKNFYATLDYDGLDRFLGKNLASLSYYRGRYEPDLRLPSSADTTTDLRNRRYYANLARIQKVYGNINLMGRATVQYSANELHLLEKMTIGGYGTVRGHDPALFSGDYGFTLSAELLSAPPYIADKVIFGQRIAQMAQLALFFDHGKVLRSDPVIGDKGSDRLSGYGAGLRLYYKDMFSFKFDWAFPTRERVTGEDSNYYYFMGMFNLASDGMKPAWSKLGGIFTGKTEESSPAEEPKTK
jgi:hemolysin activation/secretion protein